MQTKAEKSAKNPKSAPETYTYEPPALTPTRTTISPLTKKVSQKAQKVRANAEK
jgi:hypothetical protein